MSLQVIKSADGEVEYVLLPIDAYNKLKPQIDRLLSGDYESFCVDDYVDNPVLLARIKASLTQEELAERMGVSQAYISKLESQDSISPKTMGKIQKAIS